MDALSKNPGRPVAFGIRKGKGLDVIGTKQQVLTRLRADIRKVRFFNSKTHPLGSAAQQLP